MNRRLFLQYINKGAFAMGLLGTGCIAGLKNSKTTFSILHQISKEGCGRATGYAEANKIVSASGQTHVSWLDSTAEGFQVQIKTFDHLSQAWSPTYRIGLGYDNHGGPALTIDSQGFLHIIYYPHHHAMRYRKSLRPHDASAWTDEIEFGERCTYPTLLCGPDDTLYFTCRRSFEDKPWQLELWTKSTNGDWEGPKPIMQAQYLGYAHFQESLFWSPDRETIHLFCRLHEKTDKDSYGRIQTVGYLKSDDKGNSWQKANGETVKLPATSQTFDVLETGGLDYGRVLRAGAMAVNKRGVPYVVYNIDEDNHGKSILATLDSNGNWQKRNLEIALPNKWKGWSLMMPGGISFNQKDEMFIVAQIQQLQEGESYWGHPSSEVVLLKSKPPYLSFDFEILSTPDPKVPNWLPSIERATGHHEVTTERPVVMFTSGDKGGGNGDILQNRVFVVI